MITSPERTRIAVLEDDPVMGESLVQRLSLEGYDAHWWQTGQEALRGLKDMRPDLMVCDLRLPDIAGDEVFRIAARRGEAPPFLFITAYGEIDHAVELMQAGAGDFVTKPFGMDDFLGRVEALLQCQGHVADGDGPVLGASAPMREVEALLRRVADIDSTVLFTGETGVGKEVSARFLHGISARAEQPFMAVNCAAIPRELIDSELFGHEKGAFTGAHARHEGYAERARGGVLFLDEVGELPAPVQAKLLRVVQERVFHRVGGERPIACRARLFCATNADLEHLVERGAFRRDLYFRLKVIPVHVAPLRDRRDDIVPLLRHFVAVFAETFGRGVTGLGTYAEEAALAYEWPGNVRELRNRAERAVALAPAGKLRPVDLFPELEGHGAADGGDTLATLAEVRDAAERRQIERALEATGGQTGKAAALLGVARTTLWEKMRRLGLEA